LFNHAYFSRGAPGLVPSLQLNTSVRQIEELEKTYNFKGLISAIMRLAILWNYQGYL